MRTIDELRARATVELLSNETIRCWEMTAAGCVRRVPTPGLPPPGPLERLGWMVESMWEAVQPLVGGFDDLADAASRVNDQVAALLPLPLLVEGDDEQ